MRKRGSGGMIDPNDRYRVSTFIVVPGHYEANPCVDQPSNNLGSGREKSNMKSLRPQPVRCPPLRSPSECHLAGQSVSLKAVKRLGRNTWA